MANFMGPEGLSRTGRTLGTLDADMQRCIELCEDCSAVCMELVNYCLKLGGEHADADHIRTLLDCAQICELSAVFMLRNSDNHRLLCALCAEICEDCALDCEQFDEDDAMQSGAEVCRRCAEACRGMFE